MTKCGWSAQAMWVLCSMALTLGPLEAGYSEAIEHTTEHAKLLPADTHFLVHIPDFPEFVEKMTKSPWGELLASLPKSEHYQEFRAEHPGFEHIEALATSLRKELPRVFTGDVTIALLGVTDGQGELPDLSLRWEELVLLAKVEPEGFLRLLKEVVVPSLEEYMHARLVLEGQEGVFTLGAEGTERKVFFTVKDDMLVLAGSMQALDATRSRENRLAANPVFKSAMRSVNAEADVFLFAETTHLWEAGRAYGDKLGSRAEVERLLSVSGLESVSASVATFEFHQDGVLRETVLCAPKGLTGILERLNRRGSEATVEKYVPKDFSFFVRFSLHAPYDLLTLFGLFELSLRGAHGTDPWQATGPQQEEAISVAQQLLSSCVGSEMGWAVRFPRDEEPFITRLIAQVTDRDKFEDFLDLGKDQSDTGGSSPEAASRAGLFVRGYYIADWSGENKEQHIEEGKRESILESERYRSVFSHLPKRGVIAIYEQTKAYHDFKLSQDRSLLGLWIAGYQEHPQSLPEILVHELFERLGDTGMVVTANRRSVRITEFSEFGIGSVRWPRMILLGDIVIPTLLPKGFGRD